MPQRQSDRRLGAFVLRRGEHLGEVHDLPVFVGNLDAHGGLAGDDFHHAHADDRQGARQVLGQVGNAADLDAGRRLDLETGDHRAGVDVLDRHLDAEFLELELQQPRHGLQRFFRIAAGLLFHRIEDGQRRQGAFQRIGGNRGGFELGCRENRVIQPRRRRQLTDHWRFARHRFYDRRLCCPGLGCRHRLLLASQQPLTRTLELLGVLQQGRLDNVAQHRLLDPP